MAIELDEQSEQPNRIRAVIIRSSISRSDLTKYFRGPQADYYARKLISELGDKYASVVIGTTTTDCYEIALQKLNPYVGENADFYMNRELIDAGFKVQIIPHEVFAELAGN